MYAGCRGPNANGWLLAGLPFAFVAGMAAQVFVLKSLVKIPDHYSLISVLAFCTARYKSPTVNSRTDPS